jgi:UDP-N-acetylmuramate dehydrogenase
LNISSPTILDISNAVIRIRQSKLPNPAKIGNAGSFFKNPIVSVEIANKLLEKYPNAPNYKVGEGLSKVPAGWLIETAGWKGRTFDDRFGIHKKQALVLVNYQNASGQEIFDLSENIIEDIEDKFGIRLEREVNIL